MNQTKSSSLPPAKMAWHGFLAGVYSGTLFSVLSFVLYGSVSSPFTFGARHALHSYAYTIAVYSMLAGLVGLSLGLILWIVSKVIPLVRGRVFWILLLLPFTALMPFVFVNARWQIEVPRNVLLYDAYRIEFLQRSFAICLVVGLAVSIALVSIFYGRACWRWGRMIHAVIVAAMAVLVILTLGGMHLLHGGVDWTRVEGIDAGSISDQNVVLVGLDGATWTVLAPMLRDGRLPHMKEFRDNAAYGTLQVYGKAFSPSVWTTMATGVKRSVHGIVSYTVSGEDGTYMAGSNHRKVPALWNMVNQAGLYAGLINYMVTFPPEHISGMNLSRMVPVGAIPYEEKIWPRELVRGVAELVDAVPEAEGADAHAADLNRELAVITELFEEYWDPSYSFFTVYTHSTDDAEHRYWSYMYPEDFKGSPLEPPADEIAAKKDVITDHWARVDHLFEHLNSISDPNTVVIVVSDHGMESASAPEAHLSVNKLLEALGLLSFTAGAKIDSSKTLAYWPAGSDINMGATGIYLNRRAIPGFFDGGSSYEGARDYVVEKLRGVRLTGAGKPIFPVVHRSEDERDPALAMPLAHADLIVHLSAYTRGARLNDSLDLDGMTVPIADVLTIKGDVTGAHHPRGVIMARGRPFASGPVFTRPTVETPVSDVLQRVLGRAERLDGLMKAAQYFGLIDRATTLDISQTVLYVLGLPCADYMQGRVLVEGMSRSYVSEHKGSLIADYGVSASRTERESVPSPEELERLRSLGYVD